jgi:TusA-related sulfurtransferase
MKITAQTKISELIKYNPATIEAIAEINTHFEKLRNPILRKLMAPRVNIAEAAKIGGCSVETFFEKLSPLGFETDAAQKEPVATAEISGFQLNSIAKENIKPLDVREDIATGKDPFSKIMRAVRELKEGEVLKVITNFFPAPLVQILKQKGFAHASENPSPEIFHNYFLKNQENQTSIGPDAAENNGFDEAYVSFEGNFQFIDVRGLEMPQPMVKILEALENLPDKVALYVYHQRIPQFLLAELKERKWQYCYKKIEEENIHLIIYKP